MNAARAIIAVDELARLIEQIQTHLDLDPSPASDALLTQLAELVERRATYAVSCLRDLAGDTGAEALRGAFGLGVES